MITRDDRITTDQLRELQARIDSLENTVQTQQVVIENILNTNLNISITPALLNFLNNTDFIYSDLDYNGNVYTDSEDVLAEWYGRAQATATSWVENTSSAESTESIRSSAHGSGARAGVEWDTGTGTILLTGGYKIASKLPAKNASRGNYLAVRMQLRAVTAATIEDTIKCRVSVWDNADNRIIIGTKPTLTATKVGSHTGGTVTRAYVLEVIMPDGRSFYSDISSPELETNTVATTTVDANNSVTVDWDTVVGASRYKVYRRTPSEADTTWYIVADVTNGSTIIKDYGGNGQGTWTPPSFDDIHREFHTAEASILNVGELLQLVETKEVTLSIQMPSLFSINGDQFIQIEFLKEDGSATTTTELPADGIYIDRVGVSYTNGRWCPSPRDLAITATPTGTPDPPPSTGGGGENPPSGGGGDTTDPDPIFDRPIYPIFGEPQSNF